MAFTFWDSRRRNITGTRLLIWMGIAFLLPFVGLGIYLLARFISRVTSPQADLQGGASKRSTSLKRQPESDRSLPTYMAADLAKNTIAMPARQDSPLPAPPSPAHRPAAQHLPQQPPLASQTGAQATSAGKLHGYVLAGPCLGLDFPIAALPARIGRGPEAAVHLDQDHGVSRNHAELYLRAGKLWIRDLDSTHGTLVNGANVRDVGLNPGDRIQVGNSVLRFERALEKK